MIAGTQNWSLRLRISVNTSVSVASGIPNVARMAGSPGRRKGLVSSSSESGEGTVGCPLARALSTPVFSQGFSCPDLLDFTWSDFRLRGYHPLWPDFPVCSSNLSHA